MALWMQQVEAASAFAAVQEARTPIISLLYSRV
jgi:hypothetical protein